MAVDWGGGELPASAEDTTADAVDFAPPKRPLTKSAIFPSTEIYLVAKSKMVFEWLVAS